MGAVVLVCRSEIRRRFRTLAGLALIVALVTAVVLTALAGARRTESSFQRFRDVSRSSDAWVQVDDPVLAAGLTDAVLGLPMVTDAASWVITPAVPATAPTEAADFALLGDPDGRYGVAIDRPRLQAGRLPAPGAIDEVLLTETAAQTYGLGVGDALAMQTFSPSDLDALVNSDEFPGFNGPELELSVVGIGTWPEELQGRVQNATLAGLVSPAFEHAHTDTVGSWPITSQVRLGDPGDVDALSDAVRELAGPDTEVIVDSAANSYADAVQAAVDALATAMAVFAVIAGLAGLVVVGQAVSRQVGTTRDQVSTLGALGVTGGPRTLMLLIPIGLACAVGVLIGAAASIAASPLLPLGLAGRAEPDPGVWFDPAALLVGAAVLLVLMASWALVASWRAVHMTGVGRRQRPSTVAAALARGGGSPAALTGVRFAFEAGAGRTSVPARSALAGGAIGVTGVVAVAVVVASLGSLVATPSRWGWTWSSRPDMYGEIEPTLDALVADDRIDAIAGLSYASIDVGGEQAFGYAIESLKGSIPFAVLEGRAPAGPGEIALGRRTMAELDRSIGESVSLSSADRTELVDFEIVGVAATPLVESTDPGRGAVLTVDGLDAVRQSDGSEQLLLTYADGVSVVELEEELNNSADLRFPIYARPDPPGEVANLDQVRSLVVLLAGFFVLLGAVGVAHALAVAVRRRRPDFGLLRAVGFTRSQVRRTVGWQASTIAVTSSAIGIPLGIVVGRMVWRGLVGDMGVQADPAQPWLVLLLVAPVTVLVALLAAWLPARTASRVRPAVALRAE
jgi:ABC-type antimicrobial peptide transport system permease subunit